MSSSYRRGSSDRGPSFAEQYLDAKGEAERAEEYLDLLLSRLHQRFGDVTIDDRDTISMAARSLRGAMDTADEAAYHLRYVKGLLDRARELAQARP